MNYKPLSITINFPAKGTSNYRSVYLNDPVAFVFCLQGVTSRLLFLFLFLFLLQINGTGLCQEIVYLDGNLRGITTSIVWKGVLGNIWYMGGLGSIGVTVSVLSLGYCL